MFEMKETMTRAAVCPRCGKVYTDRPAISRVDDKTAHVRRLKVSALTPPNRIKF